MKLSGVDEETGNGVPVEDERSQEPAETGEVVGNVWVEIDYAILQHFSQHLYSSPNKAVEELVTNGYDALARRVDVFTPGTSAADALLVWDDGTSMDIEGLKHLWWIARSPKDTGERIASDGTLSRRMVGKFGIGKLASYAVGDQLSHLCRRNDEFLLVKVDYNNAPQLTDASEPGDERITPGFKTPVARLTEEGARAHVQKLFNSQPSDLAELFSRPRWTLCVVDKLKEGVRLTPGRLSWVLGNGMPLRPDFGVRVNGTPVTPLVEKGSLTDWHLGIKEVQESLERQWTNRLAEQDKPEAEVGQVRLPAGNITFGEGRDQDNPVDGGGDETDDAALKKARDHWADVPGIGRVRVRLRIFKDSLKAGRSGQHGRSEGFFVYVRGRLLNPDDAKLVMPDPSYGTFNRMQATVWADGLDVDLLADRERLQRQSSTTAALAVVQQAVYLAARAYLDRSDDESNDAGAREALESLLPLDSHDLFRQPLAALASRDRARGLDPVAPSKASLGVAADGAQAPLMRLDPEQDRLVLNSTHPLYEMVKSKFGDDARGRSALRVMEVIGVADVLLQGHLLDVGVDDDVVDAASAWRDGLLRSIAVRLKSAPDEVVQEVRDASYSGKERFENALAQLLRLMGFVATRDGASGAKDVLVVAPVGAAHTTFTLEPKGIKAKGGQLANDDAEIDIAAAHALAAGAEFALVVARGFKGFSRGNVDEGPMVLRQCQAQTPPVAIVDVETLIALYEAVQVNHYPLETIMPALSRIESPADKLAAVQDLRRPTAKFDVRDLLDRTWILQQGEASGYGVPLRQVYNQRPDWKQMPFEHIETVVYGLQAATGDLVTYASTGKEITLHTSPEIIAAAHASKMAATDGAADA